MLTAFAIGGGVTTAGAIAAIVILALANRGQSSNVTVALAAMISSGKAQIAAQSQLLGVESQRDDALARAAKAEAELAKALATLKDVEKQRNDCEVKEESDDANAIRHAADGAAALDAFNGVPPHVPAAGAGDAGKTAGADHGDAGQDAVRPAAAASTLPIDRLP